MKRKMNWAKQLSEFMDSRRAVRFSWGAHDCCIFAADAVRAMTGLDIAWPYRGYSSKQEVRDILCVYGGMGGMVRAMMRNAGCFERDVVFARRGDVVMAKGPFGMTAAVIDTNGLPAAPRRIGYGHLRRDSICRAWGIG